MTTGSCYPLLLVCSGTHPCSRIPSGLFCATALLQAHHELGRRHTSTPSHTKLIQQDNNPFATHGIPVLISPSRSLRSTCRVSFVRKNGEFISKLCAVTTFSVSGLLPTPFMQTPLPQTCVALHTGLTDYCLSMHGMQRFEYARRSNSICSAAQACIDSRISRRGGS